MCSLHMYVCMYVCVYVSWVYMHSEALSPELPCSSHSACTHIPRSTRELTRIHIHASAHTYTHMGNHSHTCTQLTRIHVHTGGGQQVLLSREGSRVAFTRIHMHASSLTYTHMRNHSHTCTHRRRPTSPAVARGKPSCFQDSSTQPAYGGLETNRLRTIPSDSDSER